MAKLCSLVTLAAFAVLVVQPSTTYAKSAGEPALEVTVKMSEKGFLDERGRVYGPKRTLKVPNGKRVKITFVFDESINSLAIGDTHQVSIVSDDDWSLETEKIWIFNKQTSVTLLAGENGRKRYRAYCIVDCIGMEHLNNLVIEVV